MKKKFLSVLISTACMLNLVSMGTVFSYNVEIGTDSFVYNDSFVYEKVDEDNNDTDDYIKITGCKWEVSEFDIPSEIDGLPVKVIGNYAFGGSFATSIKLPETIVTIEESAFQKCTEMTEINLPSGITEIGDCAFAACYSLESIIIPDSMTKIGVGTFDACTSLVSVSIPESVTSIEDAAFYYCESLKEINIPKNVTEIKSGVFYGCDSLEEIVIPENITAIGDIAFGECVNLKKVFIPNTVKSIEKSAFADCTSLTDINIPSGITTIPETLFADCSSLEKITIPSNITAISKGAFYGCSSLKEITLGENIWQIRESAFELCTELESIYIMNPECIIYNDASTISDSYDKSTDTFDFSGTIYGYLNSNAQTYAENYGYKFKSLDMEIEFGEPTLIGDSDMNGEVGTADMVTFAKFIVNPSLYHLKSPSANSNADINNDGVLNSLDLIMIVEFILDQITAEQFNSLNTIA